MISHKVSCEECDSQLALLYCRLCDQKLCPVCDSKIHNKGKRALHERSSLQEENKSLSLDSDYRAKLERLEAYSSDGLRISYAQRMDLDSDRQLYSTLKRQTASFYVEMAQEGHLMHSLAPFKREIFERLQKESGPLSKTELEALFNQMKDDQFIHVTVRKFGDSKALKYVSLRLNSISIEALIWLILSIKNDRMKPTDKLILSRIKEYFLLKLSVKDWNSAIEFLAENQASLTRFSDSFPRIGIQDSELLSKDSNKPSQGFLFELEGHSWEFEDHKKVESSCPSWLNFQTFIDKFFEEDKVNVKNKEPRNRHKKSKKQKNSRNIQKWLSSVENNLSKTNNSLMVNQSLKKLLVDQSISKAIPGGKYGCALMIKLQGPSELRPLSLGRLCSFVQQALNTNLLIYYKTLLIKNNQYNTEKESQETDAANAERLKKIKQQLATLLLYHKNGISLAQIPILYKKKFGEQLNIQVLGFPKLKNLLAMMEEVSLEKTQGNFLKANLKTHMRKVSDRPLDDYRNKMQGSNRFYTLRNTPFDSRLNNPYYMNMGNAFNPHQPGGMGLPIFKGHRTVSTVEEYLEKVKLLILNILKTTPYGIEVHKLQAALDNKMGTRFDYETFSAHTFQEFLVTHLENHLDVELKKSLRPTKNQGLNYIVYPRETSFKVFSMPKNLGNHIFPIVNRPSNQLFPAISNPNLNNPSIINHYKQGSQDGSLFNTPLNVLNKNKLLFNYIGGAKAQSWNEVKSNDNEPMTTMSNGEVIQARDQRKIANFGFENNCNSTKSVSSDQYNLFGGLETETGLNLTFKARKRKKKKSQDKKYDKSEQGGGISPPQSPGWPPMKEPLSSNEEGSYLYDEYSFEDNTSFQMVEQVLDE